MSFNNGHSNGHHHKNGNRLRIMSFNIRYANPNDGKFVWENRKDMVTAMLRYHKPTVFGLQEVLRPQLEDIDHDLKSDYGWVGLGRDDGKMAGEYSPIFYRKQKLDLIDHGTFWLSKTPETPGSKSWNTSITRICTWASFKIKGHKHHHSHSSLNLEHYVAQQHQSFSHVFYVFNTHLDHQSEEARIEGTKLILQRIAYLTSGTFPVFVTGDMNASPESETYKIFTGQSKHSKEISFKLSDTRYQSEHTPRGPKITHQGFMNEASWIIDYIFLYFPSHQQVKVVDYSVLTDVGEHNVPLSDHRPVVCDAMLVNHMQEGEETLRFSLPFETNMGENMYVVGSIPELGNWNLQHAPRMKWNPGKLWTLELRLKQAKSFEYKYVLCNPSANYSRWEATPNRRVDDLFKYLDLNDGWERIRSNE